MLEMRQFGRGFFPEFYFAENELDCSFSFSMRATVNKTRRTKECEIVPILPWLQQQRYSAKLRNECAISGSADVFHLSSACSCSLSEDKIKGLLWP